MAAKGGYVYILTNKTNSVLYIGVTSNLHSRINEHREGAIEGFTKKYNVKKLVYWEFLDDIGSAIHREKRLKRYSRRAKEELIRSFIKTGRTCIELIEEMQ